MHQKTRYMPHGESTELFAGQPLTTNRLRIKLPFPTIVSAIRGTGFWISVPATQLPTIVEQEEIVDGTFAENERRQALMMMMMVKRKAVVVVVVPFARCPPLYHEAIVNMMERHYHANPSIPGSTPPDSRLIKKGSSAWATRGVGLPLGELVSNREVGALG